MFAARRFGNDDIRLARCCDQRRRRARSLARAPLRFGGASRAAGLSTFLGSGIFVARTPRLTRILVPRYSRDGLRQRAFGIISSRMQSRRIPGRRGIGRAMRSRSLALRTSLVAAFVIALVAGFLAFHQLRDPLVQTVSIHLAQRDLAAAFHKRRLNFLVLGIQADEGNSDTILLAHLDLDQRIATLVSIPRDTWVAIPGHGHQKLNAAYGIGGPALTAKVVGTMTGSHIDSTIAIDPVGAKQIVDAIGGINIDVERDMDYDDNYGNLHIHLKKGEQFLSGGKVLGYMRFRHDAESDWGRMRRQQQVLHEIVKELGEPQNWTKIPRLIARGAQRRHDASQRRAASSAGRTLPRRSAGQRAHIHPAGPRRFRWRCIGRAYRRLVGENYRRTRLLRDRAPTECGSRGQCDWHPRRNQNDCRGATRWRLERSNVDRRADASCIRNRWQRSSCPSSCG